MADQVRSLSAALDLTPEVKSFISGKAETARIARRSSKKEAKNDGKLKVSESTKQSQQKREAKKPKSQPEPVSVFEARVAVTTRFRQATAEALRRLSLERKLRGERPWSQQEIIESAVNHWLKTEAK